MRPPAPGCGTALSRGAEPISPGARFKDDARLRTQDGRTLSGHAQLRMWLADQFPVAEDLRLDRNEFERSEYEIIETGRYSIDVAPPGQTPRTMAGEYTVQWEYEGDDYLIQEMTIEQGF